MGTEYSHAERDRPPTCIYEFSIRTPTTKGPELQPVRASITVAVEVRGEPGYSEEFAFRYLCDNAETLYAGLERRLMDSVSGKIAERSATEVSELDRNSANWICIYRGNTYVKFCGDRGRYTLSPTCRKALQRFVHAWNTAKPGEAVYLPKGLRPQDIRIVARRGRRGRFGETQDAQNIGTARVGGADDIHA